MSSILRNALETNRRQLKNSIATSERSNEPTALTKPQDWPNEINKGFFYFVPSNDQRNILSKIETQLSKNVDIFSVDLRNQHDLHTQLDTIQGMSSFKDKQT